MKINFCFNKFNIFKFLILLTITNFTIMKTSYFKNRLLLNLVRCALATIPTFIILHYFLHVIKLHGENPGFNQMLLFVFGAYVIMALLGVFFESVPIIFYIFLLPGYFFADFILNIISKVSPSLFGQEIPKVSMAVCL